MMLLRVILVLLPGNVGVCLAAALTAEQGASLLRREAAEGEANGVRSIVVGSAGEGAILKPQVSDGGDSSPEAKAKTAGEIDEHFPFTSKPDFEFRVAPLRWGRCSKHKTIQLSSADKDWRECAARVQSLVGENSCNRRRGNMMWPRNAGFTIDTATKWFPCECCGDDAFTHSDKKVKPLDAIWNVVWNTSCVDFAGLKACGTSLPGDNHREGDALCAEGANATGGACDPYNDRWTCCHERSEDLWKIAKARTSDEPLGDVSGLVGTTWGPPYFLSEALVGYQGVNSHACGGRQFRPAMPKSYGRKAKLVMAMRSWDKSASFVWLGLKNVVQDNGQTKTNFTKVETNQTNETSGQMNEVQTKWMWDDETELDPQPAKQGLRPWGLGEPTEHANQRGCIDRKGRWHGCSLSILLRIACETFT